MSEGEAELKLKEALEQLALEKKKREMLESEIEKMKTPSKPSSGAHGFLDYVEGVPEDHPPEKIVVKTRSTIREETNSPKIVSPTASKVYSSTTATTTNDSSSSKKSQGSPTIRTLKESSLLSKNSNQITPVSSTGITEELSVSPKGTLVMQRRSIEPKQSASVTSSSSNIAQQVTTTASSISTIGNLMSNNNINAVHQTQSQPIMLSPQSSLLSVPTQSNSGGSSPLKTSGDVLNAHAIYSPPSSNSSANSSSSSFYDNLVNRENPSILSTVPSAHGFIDYVREGELEERPEVLHVGKRMSATIPKHTKKESIDLNVKKQESTVDISEIERDAISISSYKPGSASPNNSSSSYFGSNSQYPDMKKSNAHGFLDYVEQAKFDDAPPKEYVSPARSPELGRKHQRVKSEDFASEEKKKTGSIKKADRSSINSSLGVGIPTVPGSNTAGNKSSWNSKDLSNFRKSSAQTLEQSDILLSGKCEEIRDLKRFQRFLILTKYGTLLLATKKNKDTFSDFQWELTLKDCRLEPCLPICK